MEKVTKKAIVVHSGGMDSSICLALAVEQFGKENVLSLSFTYGQRHSIELEQAKKICKDWGVDHTVVDLNCLKEITQNALTDSSIAIEHKEGEAPNTLVVGRNGLMARVAAIHANFLGAKCIFMGVIEVEEANSGYRDCSRKFMDIIQAGLRYDFDQPNFDIKTPIVFMTKKETKRWKYFCQISESITSFGSYSGAPPNEKITWGKLNLESQSFMIESDATIVAPLLLKYVEEQLKI